MSYILSAHSPHPGVHAPVDPTDFACAFRMCGPFINDSQKVLYTI